MFTFINSTLSPLILALTVGQKSAKGVWKVLERDLLQFQDLML